MLMHQQNSWRHCRPERGCTHTHTNTEANVPEPFSQKTGDSAIQWGAACNIVPFVPKPSESDGREEESEAGGSK